VGSLRLLSGEHQGPRPTLPLRLPHGLSDLRCGVRVGAAQSRLQTGDASRLGCFSGRLQSIARYQHGPGAGPETLVRAVPQPEPEWAVRFVQHSPQPGARVNHRDRAELDAIDANPLLSAQEKRCKNRARANARKFIGCLSKCVIRQVSPAKNNSAPAPASLLECYGMDASAGCVDDRSDCRAGGTDAGGAPSYHGAVGEPLGNEALATRASD